MAHEKAAPVFSASAGSRPPRLLFHGHLGRVVQGREAEHHGLEEDHGAAHEGQVPELALRRLGEPLPLDLDLALGVAHGHGVGLGQAHEDAFDDGLPADEDTPLGEQGEGTPAPAAQGARPDSPMGGDR